MTRWAFLDHPGPIPFAHRGGASDHPENTMPAFEHAVRLGYRYLETDAHTTVDGVVVAFHDPVLDRVTDRSGVITQLSWDTVRAARVGNAGVPLMEELLTTWPEVRVNIDLKDEASVAPLVDLLDRTAAHDRVCVASFSGRRLERFRRLSGGRVCTALAPVDVARLRAAGFHLRTGGFAGACAQVPVRRGRLLIVDRRFVECAHRRGLQVHVWTIDDPPEMERLLDLGVDGIMTDRPSVLKEVLIRRGQWA
ncbi:MAG TPA: glycerophosphodiester phosphodiesterase [Acidimicrobiales bacterium]|nr:glycerophosphodiester phosphodiesterase [Acidimicrobiales bacterium]